MRRAAHQVTNTSNYALLAGPANVFLDNNFVAQTSLKGARGGAAAAAAAAAARAHAGTALTRRSGHVRPVRRGPDVSPQEEFECSLGSDASVRITYQPLRRFKEVQGLLQKSDLLRFHQAIEIKNTKAVPIKVGHPARP